MNKVVCDVCGTSYPENAAQCPICGYVHANEKFGEENTSSYTYVKGGRYSKANVRKRNQENQHSSSENAKPVKENMKSKPKKKSRAGAFVLIVVLLLAIIAVVGYIALRFFVPNDYIYEGLDGISIPAVTQSTEITELQQDATEQITATESEESVPVACTGIVLEQDTVSFDAIGAASKLNITVEPADTTETLIFTSADTSVAKVDNTGIVTAVGEGSTVITVSCGKVSVEVTVSCVLPTEAEVTAPAVTLMLNRKEITFDSEGQSWMLYDGSIAVSAITWSSDDNAVATIVDGKVVAVGNGDTTVYGTYEGQSVSCLIHCNFTDNAASAGTGGVSEAGSDAQRICKLYNPYGNAEDVTMQVGEQFPLSLVDDGYNEISDATWHVNDTAVCSYENGVVSALAAGTTEVSATFEGNTYICIIRVV